MTDGERIAAAIAISLAAHWLILGGFPATETEMAGDDMIVVDFSAPDVAMSLAAPITLEEQAPARESSAARADRRRRALNDYLEDVSDAVHARRMAAGAAGALAGNARFALTIDAAGAFSNVHMLQSSGDATLDADARQAVLAASGVVPRPPILGSRPLALDLRVKYQYGL
ncbi:TonB C-terminal domain-containing protein [Rhodobium gokarnense]|uniref:Protein TonB n=1 Tax=Rhodobium gokarnense TaxID=364296 RepID=A0ABT3HGT3_9HYPH|nr:TonB C-terminal domain-containing protein [Rhodobium gokarnense]MCW2309612.1 protein TonB [Rhodobium gokarnense]